MKTTRTFRLSDTTVNTLAVTMSIVVFLLAYFAACMAIMLVAATDDGTETLSIMLLCATIGTAWTVYRVYRELHHHDIGKPSPYLITRLLRVFAITSRLPLLVLTAGTLATSIHANPVLAWVVAVPVAIWLPEIIRWLFKSGNRPTEIIRGTRLLPANQVSRIAAVVHSFGRRTIAWCGLEIPEALSSGHFALIGSTASGKTVSMRLMMQSILPFIRPGSDWRAIIYDSKQEVISILSGMKLRVPMVIMQPFDWRSAAWHMAQDIKSLATALQVAYILIQEEQGYNAFFVKSARDLLAAVFIALHLTRPGQWTLADVVLTLSDTKRTKALLGSLPQTSHIAREHFSRDPRTLANVQSTISANMAMLRPIAAMWERCSHKISLTQWVKQEGILVLGNDEQLRAPIDAINRVIFQRLTELILAQSESTRRRTWLFLDEFREAGKLDGLGRLLTKGRSKGARAVLAWQTIHGLRAAYGEHLAGEISGMCANKAFLRTDDFETAQWAAHIMGEVELREWHRTFQRGSGNSSTSQSEHVAKREVVLASQIMQLPPAADGQFQGFFVTPGVGIYHHTVRFAQRLLPLGDVPNFVPRPPEHQYLHDVPQASGSGSGRNPLDDIKPITQDEPDDADGPPPPDEDGGFDFDHPQGEQR